MHFSVYVPDNKAAAFLRMVQRIKFVKVSPRVDPEKPHQEQLKAELREAIDEVKLARKGQAQLPTLDQFLDEL